MHDTKQHLPIALAGTLLFSFLAVLGIYYQPAAAVTAQSWRPGRIADDSVFTDKNGMTIEQIQSFLNNKVPSCDTSGQGTLEVGYSAPDYSGDGRVTHAEYAQARGYGTNFSFTCLKDYYETPKTTPSPELPVNNYGGKPIPTGAQSAAQLIWNSAQKYSINPKVLLVKIATESAGPLTTDSWPFPNQYLYAMGAHCPDTPEGHKCDVNYGGFSIQMDEAAALMRWYLDSMTQPWWTYKKPYKTNYVLWQDVNVKDCGSGPVNIETMATAALYTYTPYQPNKPALDNLYGTGDACSTYGNRNFWRVYNDWFGSPVLGAVSSPLFKSTDTHQIYAVFDNKKYPFASLDLLASYGLSRYSAAEVSQSFLDSSFITGPLITTSIAKKSFDSNGTMYFFDDGKRYPIGIESCKQLPSGETNSSTTWGLDCFNSNTTATLPNELIDRFSVQEITLPSVAINNNYVWKMEGGKKRFISSPAIVDRLGGWDKARWMQDYHVQQPVGVAMLERGDVVKFDDRSEISLVAESEKEVIPVASMETYKAWNLSSRPNRSLPAIADTGDKITVSPKPLGHCFVDQNLSVSIITTDGRRMPLTFDQNYWIVSRDQCSTVSHNVTNNIPLLPTSDIYRSSKGDLFTSGYGTWYNFPTIDDLKQLGRGGSIIVNIPDAIQDQLTYGGGNLAEGRLFKVRDNDQIRLVRSGGSLIVNATNYPGLPYSSLITVDTTTGLRYPIKGVYTP